MDLIFILQSPNFELRTNPGIASSPVSGIRFDRFGLIGVMFHELILLLLLFRSAVFLHLHCVFQSQCRFSITSLCTASSWLSSSYIFSFSVSPLLYFSCLFPIICCGFLLICVTLSTFYVLCLFILLSFLISFPLFLLYLFTFLLTLCLEEIALFFLPTSSLSFSPTVNFSSSVIFICSSLMSALPHLPALYQSVYLLMSLDLLTPHFSVPSQFGWDEFWLLLTVY